jgi:hypothetical protein
VHSSAQQGMHGPPLRCLLCVSWHLQGDVLRGRCSDHACAAGRCRYRYAAAAQALAAVALRGSHIAAAVQQPQPGQKERQHVAAVAFVLHVLCAPACVVRG